ncbi:MAG: hypothetical protein OXT69_08395 [Candidatus Poribacteria bacterium]|nr:hypothetical protein [Candidatus Poribacteria bacterium]
MRRKVVHAVLDAAVFALFVILYFIVVDLIEGRRKRKRRRNLNRRYAMYRCA